MPLRRKPNIRAIHLANTEYTRRAVFVTERRPEARFDVFRSIDSEAVDVEFFDEGFDVRL